MNTEDDYLKNLLGAFSTAIASGIEEELNELGSRSVSHEAALVAICNHPGEGIDKLSSILNLTHSGAVRVVDALEKDKLIQRQPSPVDGRAVVLRATKKGKRRCDDVLDARGKVLTHSIDSLTAPQKKAIVPALEKVLSSMTCDQATARKICRLCDEGVCRSVGCPVEKAASRIKPE